MLNAEGRGFLLGVIYAAWHLNCRGEDQYAEELLRQTASLSTLRRLAQKEQYHFQRGFWAEIIGKQDRRLERKRLSREQNVAGQEP